MKSKFLLFFYLLTFSITIHGQDDENLYSYFPLPVVDQRVELLSIVFRIAGSPEYNSRVYSSYVQDIHNHFDKFKEHEIFPYIRQLRKEFGISYDAVMSMAIHIEQPPLLTPKFEFTESIEERWNSQIAIEFLELLQKFYQDTDCQSFFKSQEKLYEVIENRSRNVYESINFEWYKRFYGTTPTDGKFISIIGVGNGGNSYGSRISYPNGKVDIYSIVGTWKIDSLNLPIYEVESLLPVYLHEFNHSFINPMTKKYEVQLENAGIKLYSTVEWCMKRQAYSNWQTMINESLVRAAVIRYLIKFSSVEKAEIQLKEEFGRGFFWMKGLVELLGEYELARETYPTLESYMPTIQEYFNKKALETDDMFMIER
jgi:hypothetical protein